MRLSVRLWVAFVLLPLVNAAPPATRPGVEQKSRELLAKWKDRLDEEHFEYLVASPFVIAGNGSTGQLEGYRDRTVLAAARALKATYFRVDPSEPVLILLFESEGPYKRLAKK